MAVAVGTKFGPYQIISPLGVGGMGEVYRAHDAKLGRDVALKLLPPMFTSVGDRVARLEREARVLASLSHPHIGAIYGLEDAGNVPVLVLELVEGETLEERVQRGRLPLPEALAIAQQIADALDAAHRAGIIHRDLKPSNIKITPDGVVKVLDFGLAKTLTAEEPGSQAAASTTATGTRLGTILGTADYMSPEQARGQAVDKRTDIWAFGCVCYEMLTGRAVFAGATMTDTLAAILDQEPDWALLPEALPASIRRLLQRCLEKDPKRRLHDIADARIELDDAREVRATTSSGPHTPAAPSRSRRWLLALVAIVSLGTLTSTLIVYLQRAPVEARAFRTTILPPANVSTAARGAPAQHLAISPDGQRLAFAAADANGRIQLWVRPLDELDARA